MLEYALAYVMRGWPVLPLEGKAPLGRLVPRGLHDSTVDREQVRSWFGTPRNVGIRTVACYVLDVDPRHEGHRNLGALTSMHGRLSAPMVRTGSGGWHIYFAPIELGPGESLVRHPVDGCDGCGPGHYVVAPPSVHPDTRERYRWLREPGRELPEVPGWLRSLCVRRKTDPIPTLPPRDLSRYAAAALRMAAESLRSAPDGQKHSTLVRESWSIGGLVKSGALPEREATATLLAAIDRPSFGQRNRLEAEATIRRQFAAAPVRNHAG